MPHSIALDLDNGSPIDTNKFIIVHYNINSIIHEGRLDELSDVCNTMKVSVLVITESRLDETVSMNRILIPGFHEPVRRDRIVNGNGTRSGGCLIYINELLSFEQNTALQEDNFEHIWVDIKLKNIKLTVNCLYRPPKHTTDDHNTFLSTTDILQKLHTYQSDYKILTSDLNYGNIYSKEPLLPDKPLDGTAPDLFARFGYTQLLDIPTRITENTLSLIDLIYIQNTDIITCHGTLPSIADHSGVFLSLDIQRETKKPTKKVIYDYKNVDIDGLRSYIKNYNFDTIFQARAHEQTKLYSEVLLKAFELFVPSRTITIKQNIPPWSNTYTRHLIRCKNRNYHISRKAVNKFKEAQQTNPENDELITRLKLKKQKDFEEYKSSSKESHNASKRVKKEYYNSVNNILNNPEISAKKKFGILMKLMNNKKFTSIPTIIENGINKTKPEEKANILNTYFASKSSVTNPEDEVPLLNPKVNYNKFENINTSPIEIAKIVRTIKKSHVSYCGLPGKFLSLISTPISFSLSTLLNNLFKESIFPDEWKLSHVIPIYKRSGLKTDKVNYRPISLLPTLSKICESILHRRLLSHCTDHNLITERQAAYISGDSTINQLLTLVHKIQKSWTVNNITQAAFLDIHAAFDKVWHRGLIAKLKQAGVEDKALNLFRSYLEGRRQVVVIDGVKSNIEEIKAGVPQGSRLGPLLFLIYINDIIEDIESDIFIFADDTTITASDKTPELTTDKLNRDLIKIKTWSSKWKVTFNAKKSKDIIFSKTNYIDAAPLKYNNINIERVTTHKHLGIHLTHNLDWSEHLKQVCLKSNQKLGVLRHVKLLQRHTLDILYKLIVRSVIDYGREAIYFNSLSVSDKERLERIQYNAAKLVTGAHPCTSRIKLNEELGWETIQQRADFLGLTLYHKIHLGITRPLVRSSMQPREETNTRSSGNYKPFKYKTVKFSKTFFPYFTNKWNSLHKDMKTLNITDFKLDLKNKIKPHKYKHFSRGYKQSCTILTQIRVGQSDLKTHKFKVGLSDTTECSCGHKYESPEHYITQCPKYAEERRTLYDRMLQFVPSFKHLSQKRQFEILVFGYQPTDPELHRINTKILKFTQSFIQNSRRFT